MPTSDDDTLGPALERRLKAALDQVVPPSPQLSNARYLIRAGKPWSRAWRLAPALVAVAAAGAVLTATAATGSPNPAIWRDRAGIVIQNVGHFPASIPKAAHSPSSKPRASTTTQETGSTHPTPTSGHEFQPKPSPEPSEQPEPESSPEPTSGEDPTPNPNQPPQGGSQTSPTPSPSDDPGH
jgi:hypothetical protein